MCWCCSPSPAVNLHVNSTDRSPFVNAPPEITLATKPPLFPVRPGLNQLLWYYADMEKKRCHAVSAISHAPSANITTDSNACIVWRRFAKYVTLRHELLATRHSISPHAHSPSTCVFRQPVRNRANALLGRLRTGGPRELRAGRHQSVHQVLGHAHVRHLLGHQHRRATQSVNRHDESFLSVDLRE